ncbi:FAD dependent sulfhydryl oxidase Erv1 [Glomus cerebriforme]|uniref:Sulfhydryl oxidase n=1 Tax=Glomus cerebriforme TaxID=658196 RepID=A0A397TIP0_9GLOM|nr:FAD dependent sulfhydryl oxidase Erv1 [Glomus cerebriforme]
MSELLPLQHEDISNLQLNDKKTSATFTQSPQNNEQKSTTLDDSKHTGILLDKDGKPCRACNTFRDWIKRGKKKQPTPHNTTNDNMIAAGKSQKLPQDCPPDSEQLGKATWTFLHTMAAYYPEVPSYEQQRNMRTFLSTFSQFYPCWYCAEHLREEMVKIPPKVESRWSLGKWLCDMHNIVNERLGKPIFDCNKIDERWRDGPKDGRCD